MEWICGHCDTANALGDEIFFVDDFHMLGRCTRCRSFSLVRLSIGLSEDETAISIPYGSVRIGNQLLQLVDLDHDFFKEKADRVLLENQLNLDQSDSSIKRKSTSNNLVKPIPVKAQEPEETTEAKEVIVEADFDDSNDEIVEAYYEARKPVASNKQSVATQPNPQNPASKTKKQPEKSKVVTEEKLNKALQVDPKKAKKHLNVMMSSEERQKHSKLNEPPPEKDTETVNQKVNLPPVPPIAEMAIVQSQPDVKEIAEKSKNSSLIDDDEPTKKIKSSQSEEEESPEITKKTAVKKASIPRDAKFDQDQKIWFLGNYSEENGKVEKDGLWRYWSEDGVLIEEAYYKDGVLNGGFTKFFHNGQTAVTGRYHHGDKVKEWTSYDDQGHLLEKINYRDDGFVVSEYNLRGDEIRVSTYDRYGKREGPYRAKFEETSARLEGVRYMQGSYFEDHAIGTWQYLNKNLEVIREVNLGDFPTDVSFVELTAMLNVDKTFEEWKQIYREAMADNLKYEAFIAAVRASAAALEENVREDIFKVFVDKHAAPLTEEHARDYCKIVMEKIEGEVQSGNPVAALQYIMGAYISAMFMGAKPGPMLRSIAIRLDQNLKHIVAKDFIKLAMKIDPKRKDYHFNSALINMSHGRFSEAKVDISDLRTEHADDAKFLDQYLNVVNEGFEFWPAKLEIQSQMEDSYGNAVDVMRDIGEINSIIAVYATRMSLVRIQLLALGLPERTHWMVPDLSYYLKEHSSVSADQLSEDQVPSLYLPSPELIISAQKDWVAMTALMWCVGLKRPDFPKTLKVRKNLSEFAGMMLEWDQICQSVADGHGFPKSKDILWHGIKISTLNRYFIVQHFHSKVKSVINMIAWLCNDQIGSPWNVSDYSFLGEGQNKAGKSA